MQSDNEHTPLITIGITCYNASGTIGRAIDSAIAQDWSNIEIVIVDDCSTDNSIKIIEDIILKQSQAYLIKHEINKGPAGARQTIIDNAKGEFIAFFDDDDKSLDARVKKQYERITSYESEIGATLIACYISGKRVYPNNYELPLKAIGSKEDVPQGNAMADYLLFYGKKANLFYGAGTPTCALMARKNTFITVGGFDPAFRRVEDVDFAVRLSLAGGHFIGCPENLFIQYATQANDKNPEKNLEAEIQLAQKHKKYLLSVGRYEYAKQWPLIRYYHFIGNHRRMLLTLFALFIKYPIKVSNQFFQTAPRRLLHEIKMKKK